MCRRSQFMGSAIRPRWGLCLVVAAFVACGLAGCSKEASADGRSTTPAVTKTEAPVPEAMTAIPGGYRAVVYMPNPSEFATKWAKQSFFSPSMSALRSIFDPLIGTSDGNTPGFLSALNAPTICALYGKQVTSNPMVLIKVMGGNATQLDECVGQLLGSDWVASRASSEGQKSPLNTRVGPNGPWWFGECEGGWLLSNDQTLADMAREQSTPTEVPTAVQTCWRATSSPNTHFFAMANLRQLFMKQLASQQQTLQRFGLDRLEGIAVSLNEVEPGRLRDSFFLQSPAPHEGVLGLFAGSPVSADFVSQVPDQATSFSFCSLNLLNVWERMREVLPPMQLAQLQAMEQGLSFDISEELLAPLGTEFASYMMPSKPGGTPGTVIEVSLDDSEQLIATFKKLLASAPVPVDWSETSTGQTVVGIQAPPGNPVPCVAFSEDKMTVFTDRTMLESWFDGTVTRGKHPQAQKLVQRHAGQASAISWTEQSSFEDQMATSYSAVESQLPMNPKNFLRGLPREMQDLNWSGLADSFGDLAFVVTPSSSGVELSMESGCGVIPLGLFLSAAGGLAQANQRHLQDQLRDLEERIGRAQDAYLQKKGRYAVALWELGSEDVLDAEVTSGVGDGFLFRIRSDGRSWHLEVRQEGNDDVFRVNEAFELVPVTAGRNGSRSVPRTR